MYLVFAIVHINIQYNSKKKLSLASVQFQICVAVFQSLRCYTVMRIKFIVIVTDKLCQE